MNVFDWLCNEISKHSDEACFLQGDTMVISENKVKQLLDKAKINWEAGHLMIDKITEKLDAERHTELLGGWETIRIDKAKEIVREAVKECGNDWIPCSSGQVPEDCRLCWITWKIDGYAEEVYRASCHNGCWFNFDTQEEVEVSEIIAWKYYEKPAPYQKEEPKQKKPRQR